MSEKDYILNQFSNLNNSLIDINKTLKINNTQIGKLTGVQETMQKEMGTFSSHYGNCPIASEVSKQKDITEKLVKDVSILFDKHPVKIKKSWREIITAGNVKLALLIILALMIAAGFTIPKVTAVQNPKANGHVLPGTHGPMLSVHLSSKVAHS